jgi:hypothetical protein
MSTPGFKTRWLAWAPEKLDGPPSDPTDKTAKRGSTVASVSSVSAVRTRETAKLPDTARRLDAADCMILVRECFEAVEYVGGALALLDADPDLCRRFRETETAIDAAVDAGPTEGEFRAALAAHVAVIGECVARKRAQQEAAAERADPMPQLTDDTVGAVGFSYGDGAPGTWDMVRRTR